jgi:SAM-dependent methyltransferase
MATLKPWLLDLLACPRDGERLALRDDALVCRREHTYPVIDGIPVLLRNDIDPTHSYFSRTFEWVDRYRYQPTSTQSDAPAPSVIDPYVQDEIVRTNGHLYANAKGSLRRYPIPHLRLPPGNGRHILDVGCNWGRWSLSAARAAYCVVGVDPSIEALQAGARVANQLKLEVSFVVGDARHLPFTSDGFDTTFSYSVLQHFDKEVARAALKEMARVVRSGGSVVVQMPNVFGVRQAYHYVRQKLSGDTDLFRVRYWTPRELRRTFEHIVGPTRLEVDGFFSLNPQVSDIDLLPTRYAWVVRTSEALRKASVRLPVLRNMADSLYVASSKGGLGRSDSRC